MLYPLVFIVALLLGGLLVHFLKTRQSTPTVKEEATLLLEGIKKVCKLVTVEGDFTEILDHHEKKNILFNLIPQNKRVLLIVNAKALVGFDLTKASYNVDHESRRLTISNFPPPEVLSIDSDIKYYDVQESRFNKFSPHEYTAITKEAKDKILMQVQNSELPNLAKRQGLETIELIRLLTESIGWQLSIENEIVKQKQIEH